MHQHSGQHKSILWWAPFFRANWQEPVQSAKSLYAKFFDFNVESMSKSWRVERNWMILLTDSAKLFKSRIKQCLDHLTLSKKHMLQREIRIVQRLFSVLTVHRLHCYLQNRESAFQNTLNFQVLLAQQTGQNVTTKPCWKGCQVLS